MAAVMEAGTPVHVRVENKTFPAVGGRGEINVLNKVSFDVAPRSFVVLTGPSGCGKSTLLNIVAGLDPDYRGTVTFGERKPRLTFIFQTPRLLPWRTIRENLTLSLPDGDPRQANIDAMLTRVGLTEAQHAYPERTSLGMQRRAALARGFLQEPDVLLMDEPFVSLDDPTAHGLRELLTQLWSSRPTTVLFVTHDRTESVMLGTRILRLAAGSANIVADEEVRLTPVERLDRGRVLAEQKRIFQD
ncbi:MAG: ATP-binding cassette domain-containing protein [Hyphomicrobium sp.]|nr:ATP-binding cassette domain-containing protein [Hyphomicrobium sp.]